MFREKFVTKRYDWSIRKGMRVWYNSGALQTHTRDQEINHMAEELMRGISISIITVCFTSSPILSSKKQKGRKMCCFIESVV